MIRTPQQTETDLKKRVAVVLDLIRPAIQNDGGDLELIGVDAQGVVQVRLRGACIGCPSSSMTLKLGIEKNLKEQIPEITEVICL